MKIFGRTNIFARDCGEVELKVDKKIKKNKNKNKPTKKQTALQESEVEPNQK